MQCCLAAGLRFKEVCEAAPRSGEHAEEALIRADVQDCRPSIMAVAPTAVVQYRLKDSQHGYLRGRVQHQSNGFKLIWHEERRPCDAHHAGARPVPYFHIANFFDRSADSCLWLRCLPDESGCCMQRILQLKALCQSAATGAHILRSKGGAGGKPALLGEPLQAKCLARCFGGAAADRPGGLLSSTVLYIWGLSEYSPN